MSQPRNDHPGYGEYIRRALETVGGHLAIGEGGATLYYDSGWLSWCVPEPIKTEAIAAGLPVIDSRGVPFDDVWVLSVHGPMAAVGREPDAAPFGAFSFAPLAVIAEAFRRAGAEVVNLPTPSELN